jgi:Flagellar motor protein
VSYADFITLLFAFFVVMYSLSSVNEGKYRVLSDSLVQAFRNVTVNDSGEQIDAAVSVLPTRPITQAAPPRPTRRRPAPARDRAAHAQHGRRDPPRAVAADAGGAGQCHRRGLRVSVEINASLLFAPGDSALGRTRSPRSRR